jgi:hypothetical protein
MKNDSVMGDKEQCNGCSLEVDRPRTTGRGFYDITKPLITIGKHRSQMEFCIRDDDTSYFTTPDDLEEVYGSITDHGPVSLAVVPFHQNRE